MPELWLVRAAAAHRAGVERLQSTRERGHDTIRTYAGQLLTHLIDWYGRNGYVVDRTKQMPDRSLVHMTKTLRRKEAQ
jgi:hypothetical protein